ncbi:MAG: hypothetical protein U0793_05425 [Gemmataceae bacterium]
MQPTTPRDFLKVARQRLDAAEQIMDKLRLTLEAQYIGGYSVECSLKALILEKTPAGVARDAIYYKLTHGAIYHDKENLLAQLKERGVELTPELAKRMRRFDWGTGLRYEIGRKDTGETNGLLTTANAIYDWVKGQLT